MGSEVEGSNVDNAFSGGIKNLGLIEEYAEFSGKTVETVKTLVEHGGELLMHEWLAFNPKTEEEIEHFYRVNMFQVYDLINWNMSKDYKKILDYYVPLVIGDKVLDYGCGIGTFLLALKNQMYHDKQQHYKILQGLEINFHCSRFARYRGLEVTNLICSDQELEINFHCSRFARYRGLEVTNLICSEYEYDTVILIDVAEHFLDWKQKLTKITKLCKTRLICRFGITPPEDKIHVQHLHRPPMKKVDEWMFLDLGFKRVADWVYDRITPM